MRQSLIILIWTADQILVAGEGERSVGMLDEHDDGGEVHQQRIVGLARGGNQGLLIGASGFPVTGGLLRREHIPATCTCKKYKRIGMGRPLPTPPFVCHNQIVDAGPQTQSVLNVPVVQCNVL